MMQRHLARWLKLAGLLCLLSLAGCSELFDESHIKKVVTAYASAILGSRWTDAAAYCAPNMTWTYYSGAKTYTVQAGPAINGFLDSINKVASRDGFYIDLTSVTVRGSKATAKGSIRVPLCYNRIQMSYGKLVVPAQFTLAKLKNEWKITGIQELAERQRN